MKGRSHTGLQCTMSASVPFVIAHTTDSSPTPS